MAKWATKQAGIRLLTLGVLFLGILSNGAYAAKPFTVDAAWSSATSDAIGQFQYNPETGALSIQSDDKGNYRDLKSFGLIPGLTSSDLEILASDFLSTKKAGEPAIMVVRHGSWVSLIDPIADKVISTNIGPVMPSSIGHAYTKILKQADGTYIVTFVGQAKLKHGETSGLQNLVFIYNSKGDTLGWFPFRGDKEPLTMVVSQFAPEVLKFTGEYSMPTIKTTTKDGKEEKVKVMSPSKTEALVDLKSGQITQGVGDSDIHVKGWVKKDNKSKLNGMYLAEASHENLVIDGSPLLMSKTGNPNDVKARAAAIAKAKEEIETARGVDGYVRDAMKNIFGQEEVINTLAGFAQQQIESVKHAVLLLGGPTGVGKTSGFNAFIEGFNKANGIQSEQPVFEMSLAETTDERLLESALFGAKPPYIGAGTPSNLILWLIKNPDGGGLLFDEIEKAPPVVLEKLMTFLEKGQIKLTPYLVENLCKYFEDTPKDKWPAALRAATNDGANTKSEMTLRLTNKHIIGLGTNAGAENFGDSGKGKELKSEQDIAQANKRFTGESIKKEMKARGYKIEVLNRITAFLAFKKLMPKDHIRIVQQRMKDVEAKFASKLITFTFTENARKFFEKETYDPSAGARNIERQIDEWISRNLNDAILSKSKVAPGDEVVVDVNAGNGSTIASIMKLQKNGESSPLLEYNVGKPLPPSPRELLARAKERLKVTLEKRIIGHRDEIKLLTEAIISELSRAVADPLRQGKPVIVYFDGTPGIGKTEIAKAVAEALFDDASRLTRINFNNIIDMNTFYKFGVETMNAAIKTNPESQVMLWDELHRLTDSPYKQMIENSLLSVLDEGVIPAGPDSKEMIQFPPATIVIATGNMAAKALGPHASSMTNRELLAQFRLFARHPGEFMSVFAKSFGEAFRSRLGKPLLFSPLTDEEVAILRDRIFAENTKIITNSGIKTVLTDSAKEFFIKEYVPMEGGRWISNTMKLYIENALVAMVIGSEDKYKGAEFSVYWDEANRQLKVDVKRGYEVEDTQVLANVPRTKTDYHPATRERAAWKTSIHEGGHSIVRAVLYGPDSISEINTFGGGEGGWMEKNFAVEGQDMYYDTRAGIKEIAVSLGGHLAEMRHIHKSANGASMDFKQARQVAQTMLIDGSMPDIAPIALITNPSTGQIEMSEDKKRELEKKTDFIMEYAGWIANKVLEKNEAIHLEVAKALQENKDMHMDGKTFADMVRGKLVQLTDQEMEEARTSAVLAVEQKASMSCANLLTRPDAVPAAKTGAFKSFWKRIMSWFS